MAADLFVPPFGLHRAPLPHPSHSGLSLSGASSSAGENGLSSPPPLFAQVPHPRPQPSPNLAMAAIASTTCSPMFPVLKLDKPVYSSPPPAASNPENNTCKLLEYRGAKVAAFSVDGRELICLPQAFELFLKHLVGGLHTVYTKLKRLDVVPIVCNVEQVRILRGLGAIQPGVNRCKLISPKEFDILYEDCTNNSARPGRPPKRSSISATPETLEKLKKGRFEGGDYGYSPNKWLDLKKSPLFGNGYHYPPHLAHLPFMPMGHPAIMNLAMANHLGMRPDGSPFLGPGDPRHHPATAAASSGPSPDMPSPRPKDDKDMDRYHRERNNNNSSPLDMGDKPLNLQTSKSLERRQSNTDRDSVVSTGSEGGMPNGQLDLSKPSSADRDIHGSTGGENMDDMDADDESEDEKDEGLFSPMSRAAMMSRGNADLPPHHLGNGANKPFQPPQGPPPPFPAQLLNPETSGLSSIETLLMNIQGLIKVAVENARHREQQVNYEKAELKLEAAKEREMRETYEKQLVEEQKVKNLLQKRLRKERKVRKRLQEQMVGDAPTEHPLSSHCLPGQPQRDRNIQEQQQQQQQQQQEQQQQQQRAMANDAMSQISDSDHSLPSHDDEDEEHRKITETPCSQSSIRTLMDSFLQTSSSSSTAQKSPPPSLSASNGFIHSPVIKQVETA